MWRSESMSLVRIHFERDNCKRDLLRLGKLGCLQFRDESIQARGAQRVHIEDLRRAENLERQLRFLREQLARWRPAQGWGLQGDSAEPPRAGAGGGAAWHDDPLALEAIEEEVAGHEEALRGHLAAFEQLRNEWRDWHVRWTALRTPVVRHLACEAGALRQSAGGEQFVLAAAVPVDRAATFARLHRVKSRGYARLSPDPALEGPAAMRPIRDPRDHVGSAELDVFPSALAQAERDELARDMLLNPDTGAADRRCAFVSVSFQRGLGRRVAQLLAAFDATVGVDSAGLARGGAAAWRMPGSAAGHADAVREARERLAELGEGLRSTKAQVRGLLRRAAPALGGWEQACCVHKAVARTMGLCAGRSLGHSEDVWGSAWVPSARVGDISAAMHRRGAWAGVVQEQTALPASEPRPTYFPTNKYTSVFQGIVDSYGTPRYKEVNPATFTIITFPWLFGVMYGDIGHGLIITVFAAVCIARERRLAGAGLGEIFDMVFGARYLLLMMGLFATYVGFLYNDCFGIMLGYGPSRYYWPNGWESNETLKEAGPVDPVCFKDQGSCAARMAPALGPTPFGMDRAWQDTTNKIDFYNSFKEKNAVICGVCQMMLGLSLKFVNHRYFGAKTGDYKHIWYGFLPEVIFLGCTFGYMCVIIVLKWVTPWPNTHDAPNLLETMTNFFLSPGGGPNVEPAAALYAGQAKLQSVLLAVAGVAVFPFMLFPIPYIEWKRSRSLGKPKRDAPGGGAMFAEESTGGLIEREMEVRRTPGTPPGGSALSSRSPQAPPASPGMAAGAAWSLGGDEDVEEEQEPPVDMQEVVIKQVIHCIEFVLGSVSHTASYLRLWALSLAHAQLSEVFWTFAFMVPFDLGADGSVGGAAVVYCGFAVWLSVTLGVLVGMEALSAFLHALRLHWVEFQNKFYWADGVPFAPLDFAELLRENGLPPLPPD